MAKCEKCRKNEKHQPFNRCIDCINHVLEKPEVIVSNVLAYAHSYRHEATKLRTQQTCVSVFSEEDIEAAKTLLFKEYENELGPLQKRNGSPQKSKALFNIEDIFGAFETLDKKRVNICCVADKVKLLPKCNPEEFELTSIMERIIQLEKKTEVNAKRIDESYAREIDSNNAVEASKRDIILAQTEVQSCMKIVNDTMVDVKKQETNVENVKSELESVKLSYAQKAASGGRSLARNAVQDEVSRELPAGNTGDWITVSRGRGQHSRGHQNNRQQQQQRGNGNYRRSYYGNRNGTDMGAPLPSRFVVIERLRKEITKERVKSYMAESRTELRSVKLMSREESLCNRYLLEISVENLESVLCEKFWPRGVRVRPFKGKGSDWRDREETERSDIQEEIQEENGGEDTN